MRYATMLANGYDTVEETFLWRVDPRVADALDWHQEQVREEQNDQVIAVGFGGETYAMRGTGAKGGFRWVFANDDLLWMVQPAKGGVAKVRYKAAGLWEYGLAELRRRAEAGLMKSGRPTRPAWKRVVRADYAWDFYSPAFSGEMTPALTAQVVCHSASKKHGHATVDLDWWARRRMETLTIGAAGGLQVQVYDKGLEITEASGKTWMLTLWEAEGYHPPDEGRPRDVWRLEVRMWKDYLRDRNIETVDQLEQHRAELLSEALFTRRLTQPNPNDSNPRRWPLHPLWQHAQDAAGSDHMLPLGRQLTGARQAVVDGLTKQAAGTLRAAAVAERDGFKIDDLGDLFDRVKARLDEDPEGAKKVARLRDRYELLDDAH